MEAFLTSVAVVALAEIGDKTQLLAVVLAARFGRPVPIIAGIFVATLANHFLAALAGSQVANLLEGAWFQYLVGFSFIAMAAWTLVPDKLEDGEVVTPDGRGAFLATLIAFFLVEIGDKTQIATIALGAQFHDVFGVMLGTTVGMMIANVPAVYLGRAVLNIVPLATVRLIAAGLFFLVGAFVLARAAGIADVVSFG